MQGYKVLCVSVPRDPGNILPQEVTLDLRPKRELELGIERKEGRGSGDGVTTKPNTSQKGEGTTGECTGVI